MWSWHSRYAVSQRKRKRVEEIFGWIKTIAGLQQMSLWLSSSDGVA